MALALLCSNMHTTRAFAFAVWRLSIYSATLRSAFRVFPLTGGYGTVTFFLMLSSKAHQKRANCFRAFTFHSSSACCPLRALQNPQTALAHVLCLRHGSSSSITLTRRFTKLLSSQKLRSTARNLTSINCICWYPNEDSLSLQPANLLPPYCVWLRSCYRDTANEGFSLQASDAKIAFSICWWVLQ